jgi:hypothetical protein
LDAALLKPRRLGKDDEPGDDYDLQALVRSLNPEQMAALFELLQEEMQGMTPEEDPEAVDEEDDDLPPYQRRPGMDRAFAKAYPGAARIGYLGGNPQQERAYINKATDKRRLAQDARQAVRRAPSGYEMFPGAARIKQAL